ENWCKGYASPDADPNVDRPSPRKAGIQDAAASRLQPLNSGIPGHPVKPGDDGSGVGKRVRYALSA
ncbi:MAG: hypothetical protein ACLQDM_07820, partial [Bradyrhizobium sp.]